MDLRPDTLSGRFGGQWAFLSNPPHQGNARSLPPSSYLPRSDRSIASPAVVSPPSHLDVSRSSLYRTHPAASIAGYTSTTSPSQPVLIRVNAANASEHSQPLPKIARGRVSMSKDRLPPISEYSIQGILAAIQEDIEGDIDAISEILGRSRLAPADLHDSHLPPQGEIRAGARRLQGIEEASSSAERLAADDILILNEDASLIDASRAGSVAYGLLERLQAVPQIRRNRSDSQAMSRASHAPQRLLSSPAVLSEPPIILDLEVPQRSTRAPRYLLHSDKSISDLRVSGARTTQPVVSEMYLNAGANGTTVSNPPVVSESGRLYPLYSYDEADLFETPITISIMPTSTSRNFRQHFPDLSRVTSSLVWRSWFWSTDDEDPNHSEQSRNSAQTRLRSVLDRHHIAVRVEQPVREPEDDTMYD